MSFTLVQSSGPISGSGSSSSITAQFPGASTVGAGHLIVVKIASYSGTTGVTDNQGNAYTEAAGYQVSAVEAYLYYCVTGSGGSGFTVTIAGANFYPTVWLEEWSFSGTLTPGNTSQANGSSAAPSPGPITLAAGSNLVLSVIHDASGAGSWTPDSGFTIGPTQTYSSGVREGGASLYDAAATGASANPGATASNSFTWVAVGAAFSAVPPGPPPTMTPVGPSIDINFGIAVNTSSLSITAKVSATGASFPGSWTYSGATAVFTPTSPFLTGTLYLITVSGATVASDGSLVPPVTFAFDPGTAPALARWFRGLRRPVSRA